LATIYRTALVQHSVGHMYELVNDVKAYPCFLPGCTQAEIIMETATEMKAAVTLEKAGIHQTFKTHNFLHKDQKVEINLIDGPFKKLEGVWLFEELKSDASKIILDLEFEFSGKMISLAFGPIFNHIANTMVDVFCKRADEIYD
jgi:ribosome-associated toxin RatA of RatAB toxin-antitoxin module